jgi:hypothetical protein
LMGGQSAADRPGPLRSNGDGGAVGRRASRPRCRGALHGMEPYGVWRSLARWRDLTGICCSHVRCPGRHGTVSRGEPCQPSQGVAASPFTGHRQAAACDRWLAKGLTAAARMRAVGPDLQRARRGLADRKGCRAFDGVAGVETPAATSLAKSVATSVVRCPRTARSTCHGEVGARPRGRESPDHPNGPLSPAVRQAFSAGLQEQYYVLTAGVARMI